MKAEALPTMEPPASDGDRLWANILAEAAVVAQAEPLLRRLLERAVLTRRSLDDALAWLIAPQLTGALFGEDDLLALFHESMAADATIAGAAAADLVAVFQRDPACESYLVPLLFYKGFRAVTAYRVAHWLWTRGRHALARWLQSRIADCYAVDIHPAARIGRGFFLDHASGFVMGETAVIEDDVSILHNVTLGGTGKESGNRHPKVRSGVLIGAGAQILGNIEVGPGAKVAAGSVVMRPVPPHVTVAGVPARMVGRPESAEPACEMDQRIQDPLDWCA